MINREEVKLAQIIKLIDASRFRPRMADAMILYYCEMIPMNQIAKKMGVSRQAISRAKNRLERIAIQQLD
jgi:predicted DNA-binding protein YlxM (UPF0122 family)